MVKGVELYVAGNVDLCACYVLKIHTMVALHNRDVWTGSCFLSVSPTQYVDENTHDIVEIGQNF